MTGSGGKSMMIIPFGSEISCSQGFTILETDSGVESWHLAGLATYALHQVRDSLESLPGLVMCETSLSLYVVLRFSSSKDQSLTSVTMFF